MYGLPLQTEAKVVAMVDRAIGLEPARVALFGYAHVPWMKTHQKLIDEALLLGRASGFASSPQPRGCYASRVSGQSDSTISRVPPMI